MGVAMDKEEVMKFKRLDIRVMEYGDYKGKIIAELSIEGKSVNQVITITEPDSIGIMRACSGLVAKAGYEQAESFIDEFMKAVHPSSEEEQ